MNTLLKLALTPGEPAGIGPDLILQLAQQPLPVELVAFADPGLLEARAQQLGLPLTLRPHDPSRPACLAAPGTLSIAPLPLRAPVHAGRLDPANAPYVLDTLRAATQACQSGEVAGLVTGPVHKGVINEAGIPFTGHTEFLAELTGGEPVMMLATEGLRVALATTHLPLREVADAITPKLLRRVCRILEHDLRTRFGLARPRILVAGLNPHAGEGGHLGREEVEIIAPTLEHLRTEGLQLFGPLPADTLFTRKHLAEADAVLAMYHDQGLPVLKYAGFGEAVNITLGLPIIRTSVDHGTALELAGTGRANVESLRLAVHMAQRMAEGAQP